MNTMKIRPWRCYHITDMGGKAFYQLLDVDADGIALMGYVKRSRRKKFKVPADRLRNLTRNGRNAVNPYSLAEPEKIKEILDRDSIGVLTKADRKLIVASLEVE